MRQTTIGIGVGALALFMSAAPSVIAQVSSTPAPSGPPAPSGSMSSPDQGAIIVTATREATNIQKTAVQVSAFNAQKLQDKNATQLNDITYLVPSVRFSSNNSGAWTYIAMRGISVPPTGTAGQGTTVYEEEVPLAGLNLNLPTYDISNVQVLQGPQGTLFGRNTLAGAILVDPQLPSFSQNGYFKAGYGSYNAWSLEGAGNATVIPDVLAIRVAGQIQRRDPIYASLSPTLRGQDNLATEAFRVSVLFTPTNWLKNVLTIDYTHEDDTGVPAQPIDPVHGPMSIGGLYLGAFLGAGIPGFAMMTAPEQAAAEATALGFSSLAAGQALEQQLAACNHRCIYYGDEPASGQHVLNTDYRIFNTTTFDINPNLSIKNIFGFQDTSEIIDLNAGGIWKLLTFEQDAPDDNLTEEFQIRGNALDNRLHAVAGFYYEHDYDSPNSPVGQLTPFPAPAAVDSTSTAVYGNVKFAVTDKLTFNGGFRYTWDSQRDCVLGELALGNPLPTTSQCYTMAAATQGTTYGNGVLTEKANAPTWSVGLDYQATPNLFFYVVSRRGYRSGGINNPIFNSPCVTGAPIGVANGDCYTLDSHGNRVPGADFGLAATNGATASGHAVDLTSLQYQAPETLTDVEFGVRSDWDLGGWHERLNVTYFHYWYDNVLAGIQFGPPDTPFFGAGAPGDIGIYPALSGTPADPAFGALTANVGTIVADGLQAELAVSPTHDLSFDFNVSYLAQKATEAVPAGFPDTPEMVAAIQQFTSPTSPVSFSIAARYVLPFHPLNGQLVLNYDYFWTSNWYAQNFLMTGYDLHNLRLDWNNIANTNISVGLWVRNLTNNTYAYAISGGPLQTAIYGDPRTIGADVTFKFQ